MTANHLSEAIMMIKTIIMTTSGTKTSNSPQLPGGMTAISEQLTQHSLSAEVDSVI